MLYGYPGAASRLHSIIIIIITQKIRDSQNAARIFCNKNTEAWDNNILTIIVMQRYIFKKISSVPTGRERIEKETYTSHKTNRTTTKLIMNNIIIFSVELGLAFGATYGFNFI